MRGERRRCPGHLLLPLDVLSVCVLVGVLIVSCEMRDEGKWRDRAPAQNTGSARGGTRAERPEGCESRARAAGREQSAPWPPEPQATTRIEQLNTHEMVANKLAESCVAASRAVCYYLHLVYSPLYILCHTLPSNLTNKILMHVLKII